MIHRTSRITVSKYGPGSNVWRKQASRGPRANAWQRRVVSFGAASIEVVVKVISREHAEHRR